MSILQRALIAKSGYDGGFEYLMDETETTLRLGSARHP